MTVFISESLPHQPAFLYASYPLTATATASTSAAGYLPSDVMQSDENNGWKPSVLTVSALTLSFGAYLNVDYIAIVGNSLEGASVSVIGPDGELLAATLMENDGVFWASFPHTVSPYLVVSFTGHNSAFQIKHIACGMLAPLPFMEDGFCQSPVMAEGQHLISYAGLFLGSVTQRVTRPFNIGFGQVDAVEEVSFSAWVDACIKTPQGFFFVPDTASPICHFGYVDKKFKYEPTMKQGMVNIPKIPFTARVT